MWLEVLNVKIILKKILKVLIFYIVKVMGNYTIGNYYFIYYNFVV